MVLFLAYFMLVSGDTFRRKLVKISGHTLSKKKITNQVLDEITDQIQRYLLVQIFTSVVVGLVTWLAFLCIGLEHAAIWGIAAGYLATREPPLLDNSQKTSKLTKITLTLPHQSGGGVGR